MMQQQPGCLILEKKSILQARGKRYGIIREA